MSEGASCFSHIVSVANSNAVNGEAPTVCVTYK